MPDIILEPMRFGLTQVPKERDTHSAVVLGGQMVVFGGDRGGEYLADVWSYSLADNAWTKLQARCQMCAALRCLAYSIILLSPSAARQQHMQLVRWLHMRQGIHLTYRDLDLPRAFVPDMPTQRMAVGMSQHIIPHGGWLTPSP